MNFTISGGSIYSAQKVVIYGPEGIGKTTLARQFPDPVFIDTEDSTKTYNVTRITQADGTTKPSSWTILLEMVKAVKSGVIPCKTLVIDSLDWAETLCIKHVCDKAQKDGIEDFGYGKGYTYLEESFGKLLNELSDIVSMGIHVVCTAHATMRRVELPEETGAYDHWELKLEKKDSALVKEWADMVLFCNYKTIVIAGNTPMDKNKAAGGKRVMHAVHTPWWDAKNRFGLPEDMPMEYGAIAHIFKTTSVKAEPEAAPVKTAEPTKAVEKQPEDHFEEVELSKEAIHEALGKPIPENKPNDIPADLWALMQADHVTADQLQQVVAKKGYYPVGTPIANYDPKFISGCLVACWDKVKSEID